MDLTANLALPKSPRGTRQQQQARAARAEKKVKDAVRAACVERDGVCRYVNQVAAGDYDVWRMVFAECSGRLEWAHMRGHTRAHTRGMDPKVRHRTARSLMLCQFHHNEYDKRRLHITCLTRQGADGPLRFRRGAK
jgi:hypothetical protein